jgi:hypothetical protein
LAGEYITKKILGNWKHPKIVRSKIERDIKPNIGKIPVDEVKPMHVANILYIITDSRPVTRRFLASSREAGGLTGRPKIPKPDEKTGTERLEAGFENPLIADTLIMNWPNEASFNSVSSFTVCLKQS